MVNNHPEAIEATQELIADLQRAVPHVAFDRMTRLLYSTDSSIYQMMPIGVVFPRHPDEVSAAVEIAGKHNFPVLPRGGGSSLAGQAINHALVLDFSRYLDKILEIDREAHTVRVQPGINLGILNKRLIKYGLTFGPDPASADRATIGGVIGNNATGSHSIIYGMTHNHVVATEVVLSDGSRATFKEETVGWETAAKRPGLEGAIYSALSKILQRYAEPIDTRYPRTFRSVAGYNLPLLAIQEQPNLAKLLAGSEGTLGIITEATLNLVPIPKVKRIALVHYSNIREAMESVPYLLETSPTAVEVLDKMLLDLTRDKAEYRRLLTFIEGNPEIVLMIEYTGENEDALDAGIIRLKQKLQFLNHNGPVVIISNKQQQDNVWYVRKVGLGILMSLRGDAKPIPFIEDATVPVNYLADYVENLFNYAHKVGVKQIAMYGHASAGCLHIRPVINLKTAEGIRQLRQVAEKSVELVAKFHGTISGEHGEGISRGEFSKIVFGKELTQAFHEVKRAFDPHNILNPNKIVNPPKMDDERLLRFGTNYTTPYEPKDTAFHFITDGGFAKAVEMCNGAAVCRQLEQGVMCPSFQATRDEVNSTRGRANALRAAMTGRLGPEGMTSKELYDIFDLCLSCQACKSECPSAVDMAKLKAEFLYHYYQAHGMPLRSRIFANIEIINRLAKPFAPLVNWLLKYTGKFVLPMLGIHSSRSFPELAHQTFTEWYKRHRHEWEYKPRKKVVFFQDTFTEYNHPWVGKAAIKVLEAGGFEPIVLENKVDSGRPAVSKGDLAKARKLAAHNLALLAPYAKQGIPIVGCEPSSIAMLVGEYPDMLPGEDAEAVAKMSMMIDQFLVEEARSGNLNLKFDDTPRHILFHGHCQQKANFGTQATHDMLELIPNCTVEETESGCCGMAGSFGYEKEHYELSLKIAELSLAPTVRAADPDTIICAPGTSCRDQIKHTTGRTARHPIEVLADALK